MRLSIRWKLVCAMMIIAIGITTFMTWISRSQQIEAFQENINARGRFIVASTAQASVPLLIENDYLTLREMVKGIPLKDSDVLFVAVYEKNPAERLELVSAVGNEKLIEQSRSRYDHSIREDVNMMAQPFAVFYEPITIIGVNKLEGVVRIGLSLEQMRVSIRQSQKVILLAMLVGIGLSLVLALVISEAMLKPLRILIRGILRIAGGDFLHRIEVRSRDETGLVALNFNRMVKNLQELRDIGEMVREHSEPQALVDQVVVRMGVALGGRAGAVLSRGGSDSYAAGDSCEPALFHLRKTAQGFKSAAMLESSGDLTLKEARLICAPFTTEDEIFGGIWVTRAADAPAFDELDERLMRGATELIQTTLAKLEFQYRSVTDPMTGLFNHRYFQQEITQQIQKHERLGRLMSLAMCDIDHFKKINDTYGHQQGDIVIRAVAEAIRRSMRGKVDIPCRYGGEEFVVILPETPLAGAKIFCDRLRQAVEKLEFEFGGKQVRCTISIGISTYPDSAKEKKQLIELADKALYIAKESGRNRVKTYKDIE